MPTTPSIEQFLVLFAGYLIGLVAIRLWQANRQAKKEQTDTGVPEFRPRAKSPRSGVPQHRMNNATSQTPETPKAPPTPPATESPK